MAAPAEEKKGQTHGYLLPRRCKEDQGALKGQQRVKQSNLPQGNPQ